PVRMTALDDLAHDVWQVLVVVRAVHARDVAIVGAVWPALGVDRKPVWMLDEERRIGAVRVHASQNGQPVLARGRHDLAIEVAIAEGVRPVMQRVLTRVIGDDAASVDDDALDARPSPMLPP